MIFQDDNAGRAATGRSMAGAGLPCTRNCMPGNHHVLNQVGGGAFTWRGVRNVWHCASCKAKRAERMAAKGAA